MSRSRKTAGRSRRTRNGTLTDSAASQVYSEFRACLVDERTHDHVELDGEACLLPHKQARKLKGGRLPHPDDLRAILARAYGSLKQAREKKPELLYLRLALRRYLTLGVTLEQAFGLRPLPGRPPDGDERGRQVAVAVLRQYVTQSGTLENAAAVAGKRLGIGKTQALQAFRNNDSHALRALKLERLQANPAQLWAAQEERRLIGYYGRRQRALARFLSKQPGNSP